MEHKGTEMPLVQHPQRDSSPVNAVQEDDLLAKMIQETGTDGTNLSANQWTAIAKRFGGRRRVKECRERWENKLRPGLREGQWSREEHDIIMKMAQEHGNVWRLIAA